MSSVFNSHTTSCYSQNAAKINVKHKSSQLPHNTTFKGVLPRVYIHCGIIKI